MDGRGESRGLCGIIIEYFKDSFRPRGAKKVTANVDAAERREKEDDGNKASGELKERWMSCLWSFPIHILVHDANAPAAQAASQQSHPGSALTGLPPPNPSLPLVQGCGISKCPTASQPADDEAVSAPKPVATAGQRAAAAPPLPADQTSSPPGTSSSVTQRKISKSSPINKTTHIAEDEGTERTKKDDGDATTKVLVHDANAPAAQAASQQSHPGSALTGLPPPNPSLPLVQGCGISKCPTASQPADDEAVSAPKPVATAGQRAAAAPPLPADRTSSPPGTSSSDSVFDVC
ncbi:uncharacterized protein LOC134066539 [Sardina pilchardus]|uniref:uncharacterized protein LOC134066539 n=1 Tax=Sardina pilchardus TaxID=27697 RepID=UPI002E0F4299